MHLGPPRSSNNNSKAGQDNVNSEQFDFHLSKILCLHEFLGPEKNGPTLSPRSLRKNVAEFLQRPFVLDFIVHLNIDHQHYAYNTLAGGVLCESGRAQLLHKIGDGRDFEAFRQWFFTNMRKRRRCVYAPAPCPEFASARQRKHDIGKLD